MQTKLVPPVAAGRLVERTELLAALDAAANPIHLVSVTAPAGYGKSTLLAQWRLRLEQAGVATGWVTLDPGDNDAVRLVSYLLAALGSAGQELGRAQLEFGLPSVVRPLLLSLVDEIGTSERRTVLFLDDLHVLTEAPAQELVDWLVMNSPANLCFVVAGRSRPPLSLHTLKLQERLLEFGPEDLIFGDAEADQLLNQLGGHELAPAQLHALAARTEGWVAGLKLASLALRSTKDRDHFIQEFSGTDRAITDYLGEVVLSRLDPELRSFVLQTSVLDRLCPELCEEITGRAESRLLLERIEAENLFLMPLDRDRVWYRYHSLFADFLRGRMAAEAPETVREAHRAASRWFWRERDYPEAVNYALRAGDAEHAADLVAQCWEDVVERRGEHSTLLRWIEALPAECLETRPELRLAHAWSLIFTRHYARALEELNGLEASRRDEIEAAGDGAGRGGPLDEALAMNRCVLYALTDQPERCRRASEEWLDRWSEASWFNTGTVASALAYSCMVDGDFADARSALARARVAFRSCDAQYGIAWDDGIEGMILLEQGRLRDAVRVGRRGLAHAARTLGVRSYATSMLSVLLAEALYEQGAFEEAKQHLDTGFLFVDEHGAVESALAGYATRAKLLLLRGEIDAMEEVLDAGQELGERLGLTRLVAAIQALRVDAALRLGDVERAHRLAEAAGFLASEGESYGAQWKRIHREIVQPLRARLWLAEGQAERAIGLLGELVWLMRKRGLARRALALMVARARAYDVARNRAAALRTLGEAVHLAAPEGAAGIFLEWRDALGDLLTEMTRTRPEIPDPDEAAVSELLARVTEPSWDTSGEREQEGPQETPERVSAAPGNGARRRAGSKDRGGRDARPEAPPRRGAAEADSEPTAAPPAESSLEPLTRREIEILRLLGTGLSNRDLARALFVSETTIKWHLRNLYAKLQVANRTSAVARAQRLELI